jgi:hypothetical protein
MQAGASAARETISVADLADEAWIVPHASGPARGYHISPASR